MKKISPILLIVLLFSTLNAQYSFQKILSIPYGENKNQIQIRKEYDGSYGPKDFLCQNGLLYILDSENGKLKVFDKSGAVTKEIVISKNTSSLEIEGSSQRMVFSESKLFVTENINSSVQLSDPKSEYKNNVYRRSSTVFIYNSGSREYEIKSDLKIASVRFINIDKFNNYYFDVETFIKEIPCEVKREIYVLNSEGKQKTKIILPFIYYARLERDIYVDNDGNIYHLIANKTELELIKWTYSDKRADESPVEISYPEGYEERYHYNSEIKEPINQIQKTEPALINNVMVTRDEALVIANTFYIQEWQCTSTNLSNGLILVAGKYIRTPDWIVVGTNKQVPYQWGGFSSVSDFNSGIANGKYAGDNNCTGNGCSAVVGVDCSGFVSRCWKLSSHYSTSMMPKIMNAYSTWTDLKPGDVIHKVGHVRLCVKNNANGTVKVIEASGVDWRVSYRDYSYTDFTEYAPYTFKNMIESVTKVENEPLPTQLAVKNYPNPFNGTINFLINSSNSSKVKIEIFDCLGRIIEQKDIQLMTGENNYSWNSQDKNGRVVSSGVYYFRIVGETEKIASFNKIVLLR